MNYGMYVAASAMHANQYRLGVVGNNLANVNTTGFKPDMATFKWRNPERVEDKLYHIKPNRLLESLGSGVHLNKNITLFKQGNLSETRNPLDVAIDGDGFFKFSTGKGDNNQSMRLSRDGKFTKNTEGFLVHAASGMRVLDDRNRPILFDSTAEVKIEPSGAVMQGGVAIATLGVAIPPDLTALTKAGDNTFKLPANAQESLVQSDAPLRQGWVEGSAVDPVSMMLELSSASGAVSSAARLIQVHDELMNSAINRFARIA